MSMVGPQRDTAHPPEIAPPRAEDRLLGGDAACVTSTMIYPHSELAPDGPDLDIQVSVHSSV